MDYSRIEEVVGDFVNLKRAGANMKGLCPFHDEKTPSFTVSPAKNIYKCFGCGAAGDPVKFVMEHEKMSYPEALRYLAAKYRIEVEETEAPQEDKEQQTLRESLYIVMKFAAGYYHDALLTSDEGKAVGLSYFFSRGITERTINDFQLGYAAESNDLLYQSALKSGYNAEILEQAGLIKMKEGRQPYDFFRARVMFPIHNLSGKVVAFGGRILKQDPRQPKYINTPETEIYTKGQLLYGIYQAKAEIRKQDVCYLVEGYTDVLSLYQAGISNVVASSGTALTPEQVRLIRRFTFNVVLLYDGDAAGIKAAIRGVDIMLEEGMNVKVVVLPEGEDPDSYVRSSGSDAMLEYIAGKQKDFIFFKSDILLKDAGNDPVKKTTAIRGLVESIALISDPIRRAYYTRECSKLAELPEQMLITEVNKQIAVLRKKKSSATEEEVQAQKDLIAAETPAEPQPQVNTNNLYHQEKDLLRILFRHGHRTKMLEDGTQMLATEYILQEVHGVQLINEQFQKILDAYLQQLQLGKTPEELYNHQAFDDNDIKQFIIELQTTPYELSKNWKEHNIIVLQEEDVWEQDVESAINRYLFFRISHELKAITQRMKQVPEEEFESLMALVAQKKALQDQLKELAKSLGTVIFS
jgi:DNA primase